MHGGACNVAQRKAEAESCENQAAGEKDLGIFTDHKVNMSHLCDTDEQS